MKIKIVLASAVLLSVGMPAVAVNYYIIRQELTGPCKVVESRPTDTKTIVGGDKVYTTRGAAMKQMRFLCKSA
jgi:hypothetical protein